MEKEQQQQHAVVQVTRDGDGVKTGMDLRELRAAVRQQEARDRKDKGPEAEHLSPQQTMKRLEDLDRKIEAKKRSLSQHLWRAEQEHRIQEEAEKKMLKLEGNNNDLIDVVGALAEAGEAGKQLGNILSNSLGR
mmetsp:Transcript_22520/g.50727  ORF Transcript_22520/g.50727 Transcript_22520/m.50727 type:complete len:134 (+) Transcript_22520:1449-1850(+)